MKYKMKYNMKFITSVCIAIEAVLHECTHEAYSRVALIQVNFDPIQNNERKVGVVLTVSYSILTVYIKVFQIICFRYQVAVNITWVLFVGKCGNT